MMKETKKKATGISIWVLNLLSLFSLSLQLTFWTYGIYGSSMFAVICLLIAVINPMLWHEKHKEGIV